ncbi:MAG: sialidase family protein [Acidobacteriota bacterium]
MKIKACLIGFFCCVPTFGIVGAGAAEPPEGNVKIGAGVRPHEWVGDPFVQVPKNERRTTLPGRWERNGLTAVQVNVDSGGLNVVGDAANEPSITVDPTNPSRMAVGWRQFDTVTSNFRQAGVGYSTDGGLSWVFPGVLDPGVFRSDPVLETDADGRFFYQSLTVDDVYWCDVFQSGDQGATWDGGTYAFGGDKAWMAIDRTGGEGHGHLYAGWDYAGCCGDNWFNRSTDGGTTYETPIPIPGMPYWGVTTVGPDGEVYVAGGDYMDGSGFVVVKSTTLEIAGMPMAFDISVEVDLGGEQQFYLLTGPNPEGLVGQVWIAVDRSSGPSHGHVYLLCSVDPPGTDPADVMFARSTDGGLTWSTPIRVNDDPVDGNAWQWFGTMAVAPNGRIDVVWNDTRSLGQENISEVFYAFSTDGGLSWSRNQPLTPSFDSHLGWPQQNKLGDYYDMVSDTGGASLAFAATFNGEQDVYYLRFPAGGPLVFEDGFESGDTGAWAGF